MIGFVYIWTNLLNAKMYIGAHVGKPDDGYMGSGILFKKAVKKHGLDNFKREIIYEEYDSIEQLFIKEAEVILERNAVKDENYYNLVSLDPKHLKVLLDKGYKFTRAMTAETKEKISKAKLGKKMSAEACANMSKAGKGRVFSEAHKQALSKAELGEKNHFYGKHHSAEHKQRLSINQTGEKNHFYGKTHPPEVRKQLSDYAKTKYQGANNPAAKRIKVNGVIYSTLNAAKEALGLTQNYQVLKIGELL